MRSIRTNVQIVEDLKYGRTSLGIELGSTRIKGVLLDDENQVIAAGAYGWENRLEHGIWTYHLEDVWMGVKSCYREIRDTVQEQYGVKLQTIGSIGISGMMHGYLVFDEAGELLVPFRTWRNTMTAQASEILDKELNFHIPQRYSVAHLYQAILTKEAHVPQIRHLKTLSSYVHWKLTGEHVVGIGEASGMFPVDNETGDYDVEMLRKFDTLVKDEQIPWKLREILPRVLRAGDNAGTLSEAGARLLDSSGVLEAGISFCPPEGDAGTGMVATDSVEQYTGNVSVGTSTFAMVVLDKKLQGVYPEVDIVATPQGLPVAMIHCNNGTSEIDGWVRIFQKFSELGGQKISTSQAYEVLFREALNGAPDGGGLLSYCYLAGEHITGLEAGRPMFLRTPESTFDLANFMRTNLMTLFGAIYIGLTSLKEKEKIQIQRMTGHGGFFKTKEVGQRILSAAVDAPVAVLDGAGEGGALGIALLASYLRQKEEDENLTAYLNRCMFGEKETCVIEATTEEKAGFQRFMEVYKAGLDVERMAVKQIL